MKKTRNTSKAKDRYLDPRYNESAPEYILRMWPEGYEEMSALIASMIFRPGDIEDLDAMIDRTNHRSIELLQRRGIPAHIMRTREELGKLVLAQQILKAQGVIA